MVDVATGVIYDFSVVHLEKSLADCQKCSWETLVKYPAYEIYSLYPHLNMKLADKKPVSVPLAGDWKYKDAKIAGGYWIASLAGSPRKPHVLVAQQFHP
jgi:hypothetical protein